MDSFDPTTRFRYNPNADTGVDSEFSGILEIFVHHARNIHNICIYDNQDVYAKLSLTYNPDETFSTRVISGGGKNPDFNENLAIKVDQLDAVLKCEMWMLSRAKNYLEDQLLGFALVPISLVVEKGKVTQDFSLSSTDLFHSPAGTVRLSLKLSANMPYNPSVSSFSSSVASSSISSEVVLLDRKISEDSLESIEYSKIEFPDVNIVRENQQMVSEYIGFRGSGSFLCLGTSHRTVDDFEMVGNCSEDNGGGSVSTNESFQNSGFLSSTITSLSDDRNSVDSLEKWNHSGGEFFNTSNAPMAAAEANHSDTPTSKKAIAIQDENESHYPVKVEECNKDGIVFSGPLGTIEEQSAVAMQQQIVDMYMRSMQQFTESLAKMKLPMDLDKSPNAEDHGNLIRSTNNKPDPEIKKKDGSRVFYGSRAFF